MERTKSQLGELWYDPIRKGREQIRGRDQSGRSTGESGQPHYGDGRKQPGETGETSAAPHLGPSSEPSCALLLLSASGSACIVGSGVPASRRDPVSWPGPRRRTWTSKSAAPAKPAATSSPKAGGKRKRCGSPCLRPGSAAGNAPAPSSAPSGCTGNSQRAPM